ncbi:ethanolamine permease [Reichenbachiella versicolor]|uniref:ethanolamine permease n=1 Tax=Reichenbachiella versicolor TaxID=1821036 RepID=UPI000D6DE3CB|nr:ethanolamine permease [Reichenbachiella versicolor]
MADTQLKRTLSPFMLWGLGVGYVISGMYFGWNLGLAEGGTYGLAIATFFIIIMYVTFTFSYTELACAIPKAGGAFDYAEKGLGSKLGFIAGMAQNIEFIFAPPAIAMAIGAYLNLLYPSVNVITFAVVAYVLFTLINILGVKLAASFELVITILAVIELLIFATVTLPEFELSNLQSNPLPNGFQGVFAAIPFAIWFFLAIEGVANVAEEAINPQRSVLIGFGSAILTLVVLCILTFFSSVGVAGWEAVVYPEGSTDASDSPLPLAISYVMGEGHVLYKMLVGIGLLGLIASFHGIILAAGRSTFEFGRIGNAPKMLGKANGKFQTPMNALLVNMAIGILALFTGKTGEIITIACFGALTLYIVSMIAFFALRKNEPDMDRPFKVPAYPLFPALALIIASIALVAMFIYNLKLGSVYLGILGGSYGLWWLMKRNDQD